MQEVKPELESSKLTVVGKMDPWKLRDRVEAKTKKKVDLVSPIKKPDAAADQKPVNEKAKELYVCRLPRKKLSVYYVPFRSTQRSMHFLIVLCSLRPRRWCSRFHYIATAEAASEESWTPSGGSKVEFLCHF